MHMPHAGRHEADSTAWVTWASIHGIRCMRQHCQDASLSDGRLTSRAYHKAGSHDEVSHGVHYGHVPRPRVQAPKLAASRHSVLLRQAFRGQPDPAACRDADSLGCIWPRDRLWLAASLPSDSCAYGGLTYCSTPQAALCKVNTYLHDRAEARLGLPKHHPATAEATLPAGNVPALCMDLALLQI